eukprot:TRINITY_DN71577_c0_g1_i1.p1 TRINITY_DN71577_c0_g1~~TRINITY_DN71577_c0_g1_i1.p1  ORF type:complete len:423 (+),score=183.29 TRINITY_DN71577_c0_g1_i1:93-1271(+)
MALTWLEGTAQRYPGVVAEGALKMRDLFERRLWHDLTLELQKAVVMPEWQPVLPELHGQLVTHFAPKMNPLFLALLLVAVSRRLDDPAAGLALVSGAAETLKREPRGTDLHKQGALVLQCEEIVLRLRSGTSDLAKVKELAEESTEYVAKREAQELPVELRAHTYRAQAAVHRAEKRYNEFYGTSLLYLAHVRIDAPDEMPPSEKCELAFNLGVAALLGDEIHNFGELINNPIVSTLPDAGHSWLLQLLKAFNAGDLKEYERITRENERELRQHLGDDMGQGLKQKMQLMALLYHIFVTPVHGRTFSFQAIHEQCNTDSMDDVEPLLLRALALDLVRGSIDQVDQVISVTWIRSRVLGREEIGALVGQVKQWTAKVQDAIRSVETHLDAQVE